MNDAINAVAPCPFCKSRCVTATRNEHGWRIVRCDDCGASTPNRKAKMPDTQISEALGLIDGGLQLLLAAVHADDPKREMLVRVGDLLRDVRLLEAALSGHVVVPEMEG